MALTPAYAGPNPGWHDALWRHLQRALADARMPHAILVCGPPGVGKRAFAARVVAALLCRQRDRNANPCNDCMGCRLLAADTHPDLSRLAPEEAGGTIKVEQIRGFGRRLYLTSQYPTGRVGWIEPAEALSTSAANSLLKTLEEPPPDCHIVLVSDRVSGLMATIRSRCQLWRLPPPDAETGLAWLAAQGAATAALGADAGRRPFATLAHAERDDPALCVRWDQNLSDVARGRDDPVVVAERMAREAPDLWVDWISQRAGALLAGALDDVDHAALPDDLAAIARRLEPGALEPWVARVATLPRLAQSNADWRLVIESTLFAFKRCLKRKRSPSS